jgi:hypothetical protein
MGVVSLGISLFGVKTIQDAAPVIPVSKLQPLSEAERKRWTVKVNEFQSYGERAEKARIGGRFPGPILDTMLLRKYNATIGQLNVLSFRSGPGFETKDVKDYVPLIVVTGYVQESKQGYEADVRVVALEKLSFPDNSQVGGETIAVKSYPFAGEEDMKETARQAGEDVAVAIEHWLLDTQSEEAKKRRGFKQ